jgi:hypothetical protein
MYFNNNKTGIGGQGYLKINNYFYNCNINNFKQHPDLNYAIEHNNQYMFNSSKIWYNSIKKLNLISNEQIIDLIKLNDNIGNPKKEDIHNELPLCNSNTIKYIYFGLLNIKYIIDNNLEHFDFIEIGGGYGGQCIILLELFKILNIKINNYILIDLDNILKFQKKYTSLFDNSKCIFLEYNSYVSYDFTNNSYLFSCYCFNEVNEEIRKNYYDNLFPFIKKGLFIWPNVKTLKNFAKKYIHKKIDDQNIIYM